MIALGIGSCGLSLVEGVREDYYLEEMRKKDLEGMIEKTFD